jgi:hypothetical protein
MVLFFLVVAEPAVDIFTLELLGDGLHYVGEESFRGGSRLVLRRCPLN